MITNAKMLISQTANGQQQDITTAIIANMAFKVTGVMDTAYSMEVKITRVGLQMKVGGKDLNFDSDKKGQQDIMSNILGNMTGKAFSLIMTKKGKVASINDIENIYSNLFDGIPNVTDDQKAQLKNQMIQSFGAKAFKGSIELGTAIFPDNKVAKNNTWEIATQLESIVKAKVKTTFSLQDITDNSYLVHGDAVMASDKDAPYTEMNGMPIKYDLTGTSTYEIKLDKVTNWITEAKINQVMKGNIEIKDNPRVPGGMTMPMTMNSEQTVTDK